MADDIVGKYFDPNLSDRERATFETGIKLGAIYHILCGIPISKDANIIRSIEDGIEAAISCQPYVKLVKLSLRQPQIKGEKSHEFDYDEITGKIIRAELHLEYHSVRIVAKIDWAPELDYPLMFIESIQEN